MKIDRLRNIGRLKGIGSLILLSFLVYACARIGTPDGGPYDEDPPILVRCNPELGATNNKETSISLYFNEYVNLENASEKIVVSPPQIVTPEIKSGGRRITVSLQDSLRKDMTYTIDFSDAIVDNNESNPLGNFSFIFSTGETIDTLQVSGTVLDASNLEPIKGILVGLYANLADSAFVKLPFDRVARTDSRGRFTIRGVAPGSYFVYALNDVDQNFMFSQKSEVIAFSRDTVKPSFDFRTRQDTLWLEADSINIDTVKVIEYTHFMPDNLVLRAFTEQSLFQYLGRIERPVPQRFNVYFAIAADTLPTLEGLNFQADDAFLIENTAKNDSITYWIKDSLVYNLDTLFIRLSYLYTDTLNQLVPRTDTIRLASKMTRERIQRDADRKKQEWEDELKKKLRRKKEGEVIDTIPPIEFLSVKINVSDVLELYQNVTFEFDEPLSVVESSAIHLQEMVDSILTDIPFVFRKQQGQLRKYELLAEWRPGKSYTLTVDSMAFHGLYGLYTDDVVKTFKVRTLEEYASLFVKLINAEDNAIVQLLNTDDKVIREVKAENGHADFFFLTPGKYYMRLFYDRNGNGVWDTGLYEAGRQAEEVAYYPEVMELKANWEVEQEWELGKLSVTKQKPLEITKQKPDEEKTVKSRNAERERQKRGG